jgi:hypothetical protein
MTSIHSRFIVYLSSRQLLFDRNYAKCAHCLPLLTGNPEIMQRGVPCDNFNTVSVVCLRHNLMISRARMDVSKIQ